MFQAAKRKLGRLTHEIRTLPVLVLMPHSRCNARCLMCDIWKANDRGMELSPEDLEPHLETLRKWRTERVVLSGGEALLHSNLTALFNALGSTSAKITLLTTGLTLKRNAKLVANTCDTITVSLDGSREIHDAIRGIAGAYDRLSEGIAEVRRFNPSLRITGRCVLQRRNHSAMTDIIASAHALGLDEISFLPVDVHSEAFNRLPVWTEERVSETALSPAENAEFAALIETIIQTLKEDFESGFIAESPGQLRRISRYFAAHNGAGDFPETFCNAPWVSTVIEPNGDVRPCFFHGPIGNLQDDRLEKVLNGPKAIHFRRTLDVKQDPVCRRCVCTLSI